MSDEQKIIELLSKNRSILFVGSGFSSESIGLNDKPLPTASTLSELLCKDMHIKLSKDLTFTSDYYIEQKGSEKLIKFLKENLAVKSISKNQKNLCAINWQRIYTTNYDETISIAYKENGLAIDSIDTSYPESDYLKRENICIHLNGMLSNLNEESLDNSFKLTDSSYASASSFTNSEWNFLFKTDLDRASIILFVGYSLYDIDIKKILKDSNEIKEKTFFVVKNPSLKEKHILSKYGTVLDIGLDGISNLIINNKEQIEIQKNGNLIYLHKYSPTDKLPQNTFTYDDEKIREMLIYGRYSEQLIENRLLGQYRPYFIKRLELERIYENIQDSHHTIIKSKLGNGKSFLISLLKPYLFFKGEYDTYEILYDNEDFFSDIEKIHELGRKAVILLDNYENYVDLIRFIANLNSTKIVVVATSRPSNHLKFSSMLPNNFEYLNLDIDLLKDDEINDLISIINNLGQWDYLSHLTNERKIQHLKNKHNNEISSVLIEMFNSEYVRSQLSILFQSIEKKPSYKLTVFCIMLCNKLGISPSRALISELANDDTIYSSNLEKNHFFNNIYEFREGLVFGSSSVLSKFIMNNFFASNYITDNYLEIAKRLDIYKNKKNSQQDKIFKSMLKFSFIETSLPEKHKLPNLRRYYQELKKTISWLEHDPHFWLQYAMCEIAIYDYNQAQKYLNTAYSLAKRKIDYYTSNIDNQQARLWLLECNKITDGNIVFDKFSSANSLISRSENDIYKYRRIHEYKGFYDSNFSKLSSNNKDYFKSIISKYISDIDYMLQNPESEIEPSYLNFVKNDLEIIVG